MTETGAREASHLQKSTFIPNNKWTFVDVLNNLFLPVIGCNYKKSQCLTQKTLLPAHVQLSDFLK